MAFGLSAASAALLGSVAGPVIGGILGSDGAGSSQTVQNRIDPRMEPFIYGSDGVLPNAANWYSQNRTGLNNQMLTGLNNQWNQLGASGQGYNQMQNLGLSLMGGMAGNPFTQSPALGTTLPNTPNGTALPNAGGMQQVTQPLAYQPAQMSMGASNPFAMPSNVASPVAPQKSEAAPLPAGMEDWWRQMNAPTSSHS